jgi:PKD repeat protein
MKINFSIYGIFLFIAAVLISCEDFTENYNVPPGSILVKYTYESANDLSFPDTITFFNESVIPERVNEYSFLWDFGDDSTSTEESPVHIYKEKGDYTVTLSITADTEVLDYTEQIIITGIVFFEEDFDDINLIPSDWVLVNLDGGIPASAPASLADSAWIVASSSLFDSDVALGVSYYSPATNADDWMILPAITIGEDTRLTWNALSFTSSGNYPDDYNVHVSTTTQDVDGCLNGDLVLAVDDEQWRESVGGEGIAYREVDLSAYAGQTIYIGFHLVTTDPPGGSSIGIDNIKVFN